MYHLQNNIGSKVYDIWCNYQTVRRLSAVGNQLTMSKIPLSDDEDPVSHFLASVNDLFDHALQNVSDSDMVGMIIQNHLNENDKV